MRNLPKWILTGAMLSSFGAVPIIPNAFAADPSPPGNAASQTKAEGPLSLPAGFQEKDVDAVSGVKSGLAKLTNRFVSTGDFNKMLAELSTQDKERAREFKGVDQNKLDGTIDRIREAWKTKYGHDFDLSDEKTVFDQRFQIVQGEVTDPAVALAGWPVAASAEVMTAGSREAPSDASDKTVKKEADAAKLDNGRDVALIRFPGTENMPAITVSMIHELPMFYRVDVPNDRTGEQIYNDVTSQLNYLADHVDQWPANETDAYRAVAYHAVAAVYGVDLSKAESAVAH
jgi:hypothetical protein